MKNLIIIPARGASTRLPNKPLADINGKSLIRRVYEQANSAGFANASFADVIVTSDSDDIINHCKKYKINTIKTSESCESGTDRVAEAFELLTDNSYETVINLQGDLPFIDSENIKRVIYPLDFGYDVGTLTHEMEQMEYTNPHSVKAIVSFANEQLTNDNLIDYKIGRAHWFVRAPIKGVQHVGIYSFKSDTLKEIGKMQSSQYEKLEKLEQLRFLENGLTIGALQTYKLPPEVNTQEDLDKAIEYAKEHDKKSLFEFWPFSWI